ncbi:MAG: DMT family transporter [Pseudomonadota bacterium]
MNASTRAVLLMICASALVAATSLIAKTLGAPAANGALHPMQVSAGRFGFALLTLLAVIALRPGLRPRFRGARWHWHIMRTISGWAGVTLMFAAVAAMPVAEATAISFLSPPITMVLAVFMLGESLTARKVLAGALAALGGGLILQPGADAFQIAGLYALASAACVSVELMFIKKLSDTEPALRILLINNMLGTTLALGAASLVWTAPTPGQWPLLVAIGVVMVSGQSLFIQSMKRAAASTLMPVFYTVLLFAALYDWLLNGVVPTGIAVIGGALIVAGALVLTQNGAQGAARRSS